ncbi:MAG: hypothetical protein JRG75_01580, partial [Deltaproteobacteria bacterium]|nr:hypothetical protein [Deltaproteobacteria bacterium]
GVFSKQGFRIGVAPDGGGLLWSKDTGWNRFLDSLTVINNEWDVVVSAFEQFGDTRIISNPQVRTYLDGCSVTVSGDFGTTTSEPTTETVMEGLSIGIKANILGDDEVVLYIFPAITRILQMVDISETLCGTVQAPETAVREMATYAKVRDGEMLVIGGLISETNVTDTKSVPYLGGLPYLGRLFSYESILNVRTELVIILKPRIVIPE